MQPSVAIGSDIDMTQNFYEADKAISISRRGIVNNIFIYYKKTEISLADFPDDEIYKEKIYPAT